MEPCTEKKEETAEAILAFDTLYTTNHMQMLKLLLPYLEYEKQLKLAVFIKWQELLFTLGFQGNYSAALYSPDFSSRQELNPSSLTSLLLPFCSEQEKSILTQFSQIQNMMEMYQNMAEYMPFIQQMMGSMGDSVDSSGIGGMNPEHLMNMVQQMMSPEQMEMFSSFMNT